MHTEMFCKTMGNLDSVAAIRAIHQAYLQLQALGGRVEINGTTYDNNPALDALESCLSSAGHIGFN